MSGHDCMGLGEDYCGLYWECTTDSKFQQSPAHHMLQHVTTIEPQTQVVQICPLRAQPQKMQPMVDEKIKESFMNELPSTDLLIHLSNHPSICLSIYQSVYLPFISSS